jgi:anaerobic sulfite reductase subunit B
MTDNPMRPEPRKILEIIPQTDIEWTIRIENNTPVRHGQFMELSLPKIGEAPISVSGFGPGYADFTVRKVGRVTDELYSMKKGDTLFVRGCYGNGWPFEEFKGKNIVIVAGGTGVSPVKTVISALCDNPGYAEKVYLILGFKNSDSILFRDDLAKWKAAPHFHAVYTLDNGELDGWQSGLVTKFIPDVPFSSFGDSYACIVVGPPVMMKFAGIELLKAGAAEDKIWMSFERKMSCGIGKCGHCRIDETYVCLDGPVFGYAKAKTLID